MGYTHKLTPKYINLNKNYNFSSYFFVKRRKNYENIILASYLFLGYKRICLIYKTYYKNLITMYLSYGSCKLQKKL